MPDSLSAPYRDAQPGQLITFGAYPHTAAGTDRTPIRWRVLQHSGSQVFVVSEYLLDCHRYHNQFTETTWQDCDLRRWLNETFYLAAFTPAEQALLSLTTCTGNGEGSPDTQDKIFLLSVPEIKALTDPGDGTATAIRRRATGTPFAKIKKPDGCCLYVYDKGVEKDYIIEHGEKLGCSWWWTRTQLQIQGGHSSLAAFIGARSNIKSYGHVDLPYYGVRPALNINLLAE